jgi:hypothetical protein
VADTQRAMRFVVTLLIGSSTIGLGACASKAPPTCCATLGYTRTQVESVLGSPSPPQGSKYHPPPSPPPGAAIYTTEHGYLTVTYDRKGPAIARSLSLDFYEGKDPATAYALIAPYLPPDAKDSGMQVVGSKSQDRIFKSVELTQRIRGHGMIFVDCYSPNPSRECDRMEIAAPWRVDPNDNGRN